MRCGDQNTCPDDWNGCPLLLLSLGPALCLRVCLLLLVFPLIILASQLQGQHSLLWHLQCKIHSLCGYSMLSCLMPSALGGFKLMAQSITMRCGQCLRPPSKRNVPVKAELVEGWDLVDWQVSLFPGVASQACPDLYPLSPPLHSHRCLHPRQRSLLPPLQGLPPTDTILAK